MRQQVRQLTSFARARRESIALCLNNNNNNNNNSYNTVSNSSNDSNRIADAYVAARDAASRFVEGVAVAVKEAGAAATLRTLLCLGESESFKIL